MATATKIKVAEDNLQRLDSLIDDLDHNYPSIHPNDADVWLANGIDVSDPDAVRSQLHRRSRVREAMAKAGSAAEFRAAQTVANDAADAEQEQRPQLEAQIEQLQRQLAALKAARVEAANRVDEMAAAREQLRDVRNLPPYVATQFNRARAYAKSYSNGRIGEIENKMLGIDSLAAMDPRSQDAVRYCQTHLRQALTTRPGGAKQVVDGAVWQQHVASVQSERAALEKELALLREQFASDMREAELIRNFYADQL